MLRGFEAATDDENFGGDVTGRRRLCGFDLGEQLVEDPEQAVVIFTPELDGLLMTVFR